MDAVINDSSAAELRREYYRKWRAQNPDKVKKYNSEYWRRKAAKREAQ
jgi:hypothetical protein